MGTVSHRPYVVASGDDESEVNTQLRIHANDGRHLRFKAIIEIFDGTSYRELPAADVTLSARNVAQILDLVERAM
jgi:hypothetical protein